MDGIYPLLIEADGIIIGAPVYFGILPSTEWVGNCQHMILLSLTIVAYQLVILTRLTHSTMLEDIQQDYIRTAHSKGLSENTIIYKHALRNAFIPVITVIGIQFGGLISSSVLTDSVLCNPRIGETNYQFINAVFARDYAIIRGVILVTASIFIIMNLIVDLSYSFFDPRIKY